MFRWTAQEPSVEAVKIFRYVDLEVCIAGRLDMLVLKSLHAFDRGANYGFYIT